ncbi:MAG: hypothetical protein IPK82_42315 [Polyangiaceae bacterium]|nr:hypothetical protein [Polyangiaceae bacterium]
MPTIPLHEMRDFVARCAPDRALWPDDPLYVGLDSEAALRGQGRSCIDALEHTILFSDPSRPTCQLFTGFLGSGKTTELRRLRAKLEANRELPTTAILIDFEEYINPLAPITITDVLRVLAYALDREATRAEKKDPDAHPGYLKRLFEFLAQTEVSIKNIGFAQYGASLMLELKNNPTFRQHAENALALRFQAFAQEATETMAAAIGRIRKATQSTQVVVLADGLEKIRPMREDDRAQIDASVEMLYVQNAAWLRIPCHTIYTFPLWLRFRSSPLGGLYDREPQILPMVKTVEQSGAPFRAGLDKLSELVARRVDVHKIFGDSERLLPLLEASGGYPRDLLRMVRELLFTAPDFPVRMEDVERVIEVTAETYAQNVRSPDVDLLAEIAASHSLPEGDDSRLAHFGRLLERFLLLGYRNGREWYDLHPLVKRAPALQKRLSPKREDAT